MAAERHLKPQRSNHGDQRHIEEADQKKRQRLAKNELGWADRCHHDLLQRSNLPLTHHCKCGQRDHQNERQAADNSRDKEPPASQVGVIPGSWCKLHRWHHLDQLRRDALDAVSLDPLRKAQRDLRDVSRGDQRRVGIGRIHNHLQRSCLALAQLLRKTGVDLQADCRLALLDQIAKLARIGELPLNLKVRARCKARNKLAALLRVIQIKHDRWYVANLVVRGIAKDHHLNDGRTNEDEPRPLVAKDLDKLLDQHLLQSRQHFSPSSNLLLSR